MLLPVVIDATAVDNQSSEGARLEREDLLDRLLEYGLPHLRAADFKKFVARLRSIPTSESKRWIEGLRSLGIKSIDVPGVLPSALGSVFGNDHALVVLPTSSANREMALAGLEPPIAVAPRTSTEYAAASHVRQSSSIQQREEWAVEDLWPDTSLDQVADQRLTPLFRSCRRVSLVDRYAFPSFCSDGKASGLSWLLGRLAASSQRPCKVSLYSVHSAAKEGRNLSDHLEIWVDAIEEHCSGLNGELNLFLGPDFLYRAIAHDRYLRFDDSRVIDIGKGVDAFAGGKIRQRCPFNYRVIRRSDQLSQYRDLENRLGDNRDVYTRSRSLGTGFERSS